MLFPLLLPLLLASVAGAATVATISASSGGAATKPDFGEHQIGKLPSKADVITFSAVDTLDGIPYSHFPAPQTKFVISPFVPPQPKDPYTPMIVHDVSTKFSSVGNALATGSSTVSGTPPSATYTCSWRIAASATAGVPPGTGTATATMLATADDPIVLRSTEFEGGISTYDLFLPVSISGASFGGRARTGFHLSYETASGIDDLLQITLGSTGIAVTGAGGNVSYYLADSVTQTVPDPTHLMSADDISSWLGAHTVGGDSLAATLTLLVEVSGVAIPTDPIPGTVDELAWIHVDTWASDDDELSRAMVTAVSPHIAVPDPSAFSIVVPSPSMEIAFDGGPSTQNDDVCLYGKNSLGEWTLEGLWDWNVGGLRVIAPPPGMTLYRLVGCGNSASFKVTVTTPMPPMHPVTPFTPPTMPDFALGGVGPGAFNATLGLGGGAPPVFPIMPGLPLHAVPQFIGANHWAYIPLQFNMQPDPSRPWLYVGNNPSQPFVQSTQVQIVVDGLFDPIGNPVPSLPLVVDFVQGPIHRTFQVNAIGFPGNVQVPSVDLGQILAQPYQLTVGVQDPGGGLATASALSSRSASPSATETAPGYVSLNAIAVTLGGSGTTAVSAPPRTTNALELAAPSPNPCRTATRIGFTIPRADRVRVAIYDMQGRQVRSLADAALPAGEHSVTWDGRDGAEQPLAVGLYLARVETSGGAEARKITLIH